MILSKRIETKIFEVRDAATHIGVLATRMISEHPAEQYELARNGYAFEHPLVLLAKLDGGKATYSPHDWLHDGNNTLFEAHQYIAENFCTLETGDVVDVEFITGRAKTCKITERLTERAW